MSYAHLTLCLATAMVLAGCKTTTASVVRADKHQRFLDVQSTSDEKTAMAAPAEDRDFRAAISDLESTMAKRPEHDGLLNLAQLYLLTGSLDKAEDACRRAIRQNTKSVDARLVLAQIALRRGNEDMAFIILNGIGGDDSKDSQVINMLAMIALRQDKPALALTYLKKALTINPGDVAARMNLGVMYLKYRQLGEAAVQFERVLSVMPDHADARLHLAIVQSARGNSDQAEKVFNSILSSKSDNPLALYNLAVVQKRKEDYGKAMDNLKAYLKTGAARKQDTDQVFALIQEIQDERGGTGVKVSDAEIQSLAAQGEKARASRQAKSDPQRAQPKGSLAAKALVGDEEAENAEAKATTSKASAPATKSESPAVKPTTPAPKKSSDEISDLEDELLK